MTDFPNLVSLYMGQAISMSVQVVFVCYVYEYEPAYLINENGKNGQNIYHYDTAHCTSLNFLCNLLSPCGVIVSVKTVIFPGTNLQGRRFLFYISFIAYFIIWGAVRQSFQKYKFCHNFFSTEIRWMIINLGRVQCLPLPDKKLLMNT